MSYFEKNGVIRADKGLDTPTRILNRSNDFLPITYNETLKKVNCKENPIKENESKDSKTKASLVT